MSNMKKRLLGILDTVWRVAAKQAPRQVEPKPELWYAMHDHGHGYGPHQHHPDNDGHGSHDGVPLVQRLHANQLHATKAGSMEVINNGEPDEEGEFRGQVVIKEVGEWVVHISLDERGNEINRVGFPKRPLASEEALRASLDSDEYYQREMGAAAV